MIQCSSITAACSHTEKVGPSSRVGSPSESTAVGSGWCCQDRLHTKPAVQTNRRMHSHRNSNGSTGNRLVTGSLR